MTASRGPVVVLGGGRSERASAVSRLAGETEGTVLVLTSAPHLLDPDLDTGVDGTVEVRVDDPLGRVASYLSGAETVDDPVLAALATGSDSPLAAVLGWEYARLATASGAWDTVVVDVDGTTSALRRLSAAGELAVFVEDHWPVHQRYAAMAAGERAPVAVREAHRLAETIGRVADFVSGPMRLEVVGEPTAERERLLALADLARGSTSLEVTRSEDGRYLAVVPATGWCADPVVSGHRLVLRIDGVVVAPPLPALLRRCVPVEWWVGESPSDRIVVAFAPDVDLWPPSLHTPVGSTAAG